MINLKRNNTKEKSKTFEDLLKLFQDNKGKDIMLNKKNDKYSIRVYDNIYNIIGNLNIKYYAYVHILFMENTVQVTPCKRGKCLYEQTKIFNLNDNITKMKSLLPDDYLTALIKYMK